MKKTVAETSETASLSGNGNILAYLQEKNGVHTTLGPWADWPMFLHTGLRIMAHSPQPMGLFWGEDSLFFYNDALRPYIESSDHVQGMPGEKIWKNSWSNLYPHLARLLKQEITPGFAYTPEAVFPEGKSTHAGCRFYYSPLADDTETPRGVVLTCIETESANTFAQAAEPNAENNPVHHPGAKPDPEAGIRLALSQAMMGTFDIDLHTDELHSSYELGCIFGLPDSPLKREDLANAILPDDRQLRARAYNELLDTGKLNYECRISIPDGSIRWIKVTGRHIYDQAGKPVSITGIVQDVTTHKEIEEKSSISNAIIRFSDDAIISKRLDGTITSWNKAAERIFGYTAEEMIGQSIIKLIPPDRLQEEPDIIARQKRGELVDHFETQRLTKDKKLIDLSLTISPIKDLYGNIIGASKIARDITHQKMIERLVAENEERLKILVEASEMGTWELNLKTKEVGYSKRYLKIFGFDDDQEQPEHKELLNHIHPEDLPVRNKAFAKAYKTGILSYVIRIIWKDGSTHWIEVKGKVFYDEKGKPEKASGVIWDITEEKNFAQELEIKISERTRELVKINEQLKKSNHDLEQFAYIASHDLQEPLRKIQTFSDLLRHYTNEPAMLEKYNQKISTSAQRMSVLIKDVLNYSRLAQVNIEFSPVKLEEVIDHIKTDFELMMEEKNAEIICKNLPTIHAIPLQVNQLFSNLVSNALKFCSARPVIKISSKKLTRAKLLQHDFLNPANTYYHIIFSDNGIGFEQQYAEQIFTIFQRLNDKESYSGTGIGLALCKKIVENHGGYISAESQVNKGTSFHIYLPVKKEIPV